MPAPKTLLIEANTSEPIVERTCTLAEYHDNLRREQAEVALHRSNGRPRMALSKAETTCAERSDGWNQSGVGGSHNASGCVRDAWQLDGKTISLWRTPERL